ncbi:MAG: glycosyltransferase family 9 protein [Desulfovibrio sp.]|nr:glycosyltransferase family 9 protein [Desulfovibrio sp.]
MAKFLVVQAARFGDLVQTKRLILTLRERGEVHLAVDADLVPLARLLYPEVAVYGLAFHGHDGEAAQARNLAAFAELRDLAPDLVYNCNFSGLTGALCRLFPPETVVGYRPAPVSDGGLLRSPWARLAFQLSRRRRLSPLNLVDFWAWFAQAPIAPERLNPEAKPGGRGLGVALSGREARRSLPVPLLAEVVKTVSGVLGGPRIFLLGSAAERPAAHKLLRQLPPKLAAQAEDLSGKTDWEGLVEAVRGLDLLVTPDTGLMHLAAHLGTPVLAFFLSSAWCHETGPYGLGHTVWQAATPCAPCLESAPCPHEVACLELFQDAAFARLLARSLASSEGLPTTAGPLPPGLQCWQSGFDGLGAKLHLLAGADPDAFLREGARAVLADWLDLAPGVVTAPHPEGQEQREELARLREALLPDAEWMLPQGRYT